MKKVNKIVFVLLVLCSFANKSKAQAGIYMKVAGITGDVITPTIYKNYILVSSYQGGVGRGIGSTGEVTLPSVSEITLSLPLGSASLPLLGSIFNTAGPIASADFYFVGTGCNCPYYRVHLENVLVSGFSDTSGGDVPTNSISLHFDRIAWAYYKANSTTPTNKTGYDLTTLKPFNYSFP